jgi:hypothetical protein
MGVKSLVWRKFGPKREEVTGGWRKVHNVELRNVYSLPSIIGMIKSRSMGEMKNEYRLLVGKPDGQRPLGKI